MSTRTEFKRQSLGYYVSRILAWGVLVYWAALMEGWMPVIILSTAVIIVYQIDLFSALKRDLHVPYFFSVAMLFGILGCAWVTLEFAQCNGAGANCIYAIYPTFPYWVVIDVIFNTHPAATYLTNSYEMVGSAIVYFIIGGGVGIFIDARARNISDKKTEAIAELFVQGANAQATSTRTEHDTSQGQ